MQTRTTKVFRRYIFLRRPSKIGNSEIHVATAWDKRENEKQPATI